jgi:hypothetical protein
VNLPRDPLLFVFAALDDLPAPTEFSVEDFRDLEAVAAGLERLTINIGAQIAAVEFRRRAGVPIAELAGEIAWLELLSHRGVLARKRLHSFTVAAAEASGVPIAAERGD